MALLEGSMKKYFLLYAKGIAMGAADVVPGVSGGTIAFISGIYDELLRSIASVPEALMQLVKDRKGSPHTPKQIEIVDSLPLTTTNKIQRGELKALAPTLVGTAISPACRPIRPLPRSASAPDRYRAAARRSAWRSA